MREAEAAVDLARRAGELILEHAQELGQRSKGRFDLVTNADLAAEDFLAAEIGRRFPDHRLLAEESSARKPQALDGPCWVIDPLDGTVNFAGSVPFFSVSLALLVDGEPTVGVVYDPLHEELFSAERGAGARLNGELLVRAEPPPLVGGSSGLLAWCARHRPAALEELLEDVGKLRIFGSQALHLCYAAAGRLAAAVSFEACLWDDVAGALIVREAGLRYTDFEGRKRFPVVAGSQWHLGQGGRSLAASVDLHGRLVALFGDPAGRSEG
ncbi:MAG: inositol monophosphatase, partial [Acidobacteriota bacterium]